MKKKSLVLLIKSILFRRGLAIFVLILSALTVARGEEMVVNPPGGDKDAVPLLVNVLEQARAKGISTIRINPGNYHIYPDMAPERFFHVSNHDHGLRRTGRPIWDMENLTIEAEGAVLLAHLQAFIPVAIYDPTNVHGINTLVVDQSGPKSVVGELQHFQQYGLEFARPGERLRFSKQRNLEAYGERTVESVRRIKFTRFEVTFGPEERGLPEKSNAPFHKNIRLINNEFYLASPSIIEAHRVDGLEFSGNIIRASKWYEPRKRGKPMDIERCSNVSVSGNTGEIKGLKLG